MQRSVRSEMNHALECAVSWANHLDLPLIVLYCFVSTYPGANERGFAFLIEGLSEAQASLQRRGIQMIVRQALTSVPDTVLESMQSLQSPLLITDRGYERTIRGWRKEIAERAPGPVLQAESDVVVPVETASTKGYSSAAPFRKVLSKHIDVHLLPLPEVTLRHSSLAINVEEVGWTHLFDVRHPDAALASLGDSIDRSVPRVPFKKGGTTQAKQLLARFLRDRLAGYGDQRKEAWARKQSFLSAYLHFGHISVLQVAMKVKQHTSSPAEARRRFLDELITWREYAVNFVYYNPGTYDNYNCIPAWARDTLEAHRTDKRDNIYTLEQLEKAQTYDDIWNAAQQEMVYTGYMMNYLRMYWAKQIIIWTEDPAEAYRRVMYLNDCYFIDGRDPNGYLGVAWCFGYAERPMPPQRFFGKVRSMTANGLRRKQDIDRYVAQVQDFVARIKKGRDNLGVADWTYATPPRSDIQAHMTPSPTASSAAKASRKLGEPVPPAGGGCGSGKKRVGPSVADEEEQADERDYVQGGGSDRIITPTNRAIGGSGEAGEGGGGGASFPLPGQKKKQKTGGNGSGASSGGGRNGSGLITSFFNKKG